MRWSAVFCVSLALTSFPVLGQNAPERAAYLALAKRGWVYDLNNRRMRRDPSQPPIRFDSTAVARGPVCLFGDPPHPLSTAIVGAFDHLLHRVFGAAHDVATVPGPITGCPPRQRIYLRFYDGAAPAGPLNDDMRQLDEMFGIGFPTGWVEPIRGPGQTNGFFGSRGAAAHLLVAQPAPGRATPLEHEYFASILIEELFQAVTYGADILKFDRAAPFLSKLQEVPVNLRAFGWTSARYMEGIVASNPSGLCGFDVFMLHALAEAELADSNSADLLTSIDAGFDGLRAQTLATLADPQVAPLLDADCLTLPD